MASATAITYVNGSLIGDPLDVKMFEATKWILDETHDQPAVSEDGPASDDMVLCYTYPVAAEGSIKQLWSHDSHSDSDSQQP